MPMVQTPPTTSLLAGEQARVKVLTMQDEQQAGQGQPRNPLTGSPLLQGIAAASLMLVAAVLWSTVRRPAADVQTQPAL